MIKHIFTLALCLQALCAVGQISIPPAPGHREKWLYRNSRFTEQSEYDYAKEGGFALCCLHLFRDTSGIQYAWLQNLRLPPSRLRRVWLLIGATDSLYEAGSEIFTVPPLGSPYPTSLHICEWRDGRLSPAITDFDRLKAAVLVAILKSRTQ